MLFIVQLRLIKFELTNTQKLFPSTKVHAFVHTCKFTSLFVRVTVAKRHFGSLFTDVRTNEFDKIRPIHTLNSLIYKLYFIVRSLVGLCKK